MNLESADKIIKTILELFFFAAFLKITVGGACKSTNKKHSVLSKTFHVKKREYSFKYSGI